MWVSKREYQGLLDRVAAAESRAAQAEESLELERHENRLAERHWSNAILRAKQAYPMAAEKPVEATKPPPRQPVIDPGELEALQNEARRLNIDPREAERILRAEKGLN